MKHIKNFNETKKNDKVEDQEVLFNAEVLADKDEKPSITTDVEEDQEKVKKEFDKQMTKVHKFENFTIEIDVEVKPEVDEYEQSMSQEVGCGCCQACTGQNDCDCCQDCTCNQEEVEETNPETDVKVMNIADFMNSIAGQ